MNHWWENGKGNLSPLSSRSYSGKKWEKGGRVTGGSYRSWKKNWSQKKGNNPIFFARKSQGVGGCTNHGKLREMGKRIAHEAIIRGN